MDSIYVVVLNWNRPEDTIDCLKSIEKTLQKETVHVLVVDNASSDDSVNALNKFARGKNFIEIIQNSENLGFAGGNNVGIQKAIENKADYIFILNNDTVVDENIFQEFLDATKKFPKAGIFTPKIYFSRGFEFHDRYKNKDLGNVIWSVGGEIDWDNIYGRNIGVDAVDSGQFSKTKEVDFATGAAMFVITDVFEKIGKFDEKYFMYLEDVDFSIRAKKEGWNINYVPNAKVWHKVAQSSGIGSNLNDYFLTRNRLYFGMKYASMRTKIALVRESFKFLLSGRDWQKKGVVSFYIGKFGRGIWK